MPRTAAARVDELYTEHSGQLNRFMLKLTRDREEAADLVQDVFLRLCQQNGVPEYPKEWLSLTGYRLFVDRWRRKRRANVTLLPRDYAVACPSVTPEQVILDKEFERLARQHLSRLQHRTCAATELRLFKHCSYAEIAVLLGCNENTVKSCVRRGKAHLAKGF